MQTTSVELRSDAVQQMLMEARINLRLSQAEVALRLGKPQSFVSKYERGERRLDVVEFIHVCNALKLDPARQIRQLQKLKQQVQSDS
jgi:transcriptional regulator with XRE-family HTH domain